jgi:rubrerythrin
LNIRDFLTAAAELEMAVAMIYETMADLSLEVGVARHLSALANDETRHANSITAGKRYHQEMSDAFGRNKMEGDEVQKGIEEGNAFRASLMPGYTLVEGSRKCSSSRGALRKSTLPPP